MFGIGMPELAVILVVALIVLGPRRLPEMARALGKGLAEFRKVTGDVNKELQGARDLIEREAREHERLQRDQEREARLAGTKTESRSTTKSEPNAAAEPAADGPETGDRESAPPQSKTEAAATAPTSPPGTNPGGSSQSES